MADTSRALVNNIEQATAGTYYSQPYSTEDFRDFAFMLKMNTTSGSGSDQLDVYIEQCDNSNFTPAQNVSTVKLEQEDGTQVDKFVQVVGGTTLPADTHTATILRQFLNYRNSNIDQFIRVKYVLTGTPANLGPVRVDVIANRKI